jgi:uncharacterized membrane protein
VGEVGPVTLKNLEEWEREVSFAPTRPGKGQRVEFLLYKGEEGKPSLNLHLLIDVEQP